MPPAKRQKKTAPKRAIPMPGRSGRPLSERYAPRSIDEVIMYQKTRDRIRDWIRARAKCQGFGMLLILAGRPGIGKSAAVEAVCADAGLEIARWRGVVSGESQLNQLRSYLEEAQYPRLGKRRGIVLLEELPTDEQFKPELRNILLQAATMARRPVVLVWSEGISEKSEARIVMDRMLGDKQFLDASCIEYIEVNAVTDLKICNRLKAIAAAEMPSRIPSQTQLEALSVQADGDLRASISRLEVLLTRSSSENDDTTSVIPNEDDQGRHAGDSASDLHAIGRLLRAKRNEQNNLTFDPERLIHRMDMKPETTACFIQYNCIDFFGIHSPAEDLWATLDDLAVADLFIARKYSTSHARDTGDPVYPEGYFASITARTVAARNTKPAASAFRPLHKPRLFDLPKSHDDYADVDITPALEMKQQFDSCILDSSIMFRKRSFRHDNYIFQEEDTDTDFMFNDSSRDTSGLLPEDDIIEE